MNKKLIINASPSSVEIALIEQGKLVEIHKQKTNTNFSVGDVFLGRIKKTVPGLNAAFVDIGHKKDAFLHYTDLGPQLNSIKKYTNAAINKNINTHLLESFEVQDDIIKTGKIDAVLKKRDQVLVQILKEPISTKGPRLSCELTLPGRHLILAPFNQRVNISKKIVNKEERTRLKRLVESIKPKGFGIVVRTAAEGIGVKEIHIEMTKIMAQWENIYNQLQNANAPLKMMSELDKTSSILRDILTDSFNEIIVNDPEMYLSIRAYLENISPGQVKIVKEHKTGKPIFDEYGVTRQIKSSFGKTASMPSGAYLVIEGTEAMHVIDVNSGNRMSKSNHHDAIFKVNLESAEEIARQLRLRDIGGLIIVDFIDMKSAEHRKILLNKMRDFMVKDRAQHTILPLSKFGLMQITRQRVKPAVKFETAEKCATCNGTGKSKASIIVLDEIERDLKYITQTQMKAPLRLEVHPFVESFLVQGYWKSMRRQWQKTYDKKIKIIANNSYSLSKFKFFNDNTNDELRLN